jgi:hypothetical protein
VSTAAAHETAARAGWRGVIEEYRRFLPVSAQAARGGHSAGRISGSLVDALAQRIAAR